MLDLPASDSAIRAAKGNGMLRRVQAWLNAVAEWVGGDDPRRAYYEELVIGAYEVRDCTIIFANGKSLTFASPVLQTRQVDRTRLMVLTGKPPPDAADQRNLFCVSGRASWYWASPDDQSHGHYTTMEVEPDRLVLATDAGWHVELTLPGGDVLNEWRAEHGPRYRLAGGTLTFTGGRTEAFGSRILQTVDAGPLVIVLTERGLDDSPAENIAAVDESRLLWRIPKHRHAKDEKGKPLPYTGIRASGGRVSALGYVVMLYLDPMTGNILEEVQTWR